MTAAGPAHQRCGPAVPHRRPGRYKALGAHVCEAAVVPRGGSPGTRRTGPPGPTRVTYGQERAYSSKELVEETRTWSERAPDLGFCHNDKDRTRARCVRATTREHNSTHNQLRQVSSARSSTMTTTACMSAAEPRHCLKAGQQVPSQRPQAPRLISSTTMADAMATRPVPQSPVHFGRARAQL